MARSKYSRGLKIKVAKEAMLPENQGLEHVIAEKYHVMPWTVIKWRDHLQQVGEENAFKKGYTLKKRSTPREVELEKENAQLREEALSLLLIWRFRNGQTFSKTPLWWQLW